MLEQACQWLCARRCDYSHNDELWEVRFRWAEVKPGLQADLLSGDDRFSPLRRVNCAAGDLEMWSALDSLVLKAMAIVLARHLIPQLSSRGYHPAGNVRSPVFECHNVITVVR